MFSLFLLFSFSQVEIQINGEATIYSGDSLIEAINESTLEETSIISIIALTESLNESDFTYSSLFSTKSLLLPYVNLTIFEIRCDLDNNTLPDYAFSGVTSLQTIIAQKATSFGDFTFASYSSLTTVDSPLLQSIGMYCFQRCYSLRSLPSEVFYQLTQIGEGSFSDISSYIPPTSFSTSSSSKRSKSLGNGAVVGITLGSVCFVLICAIIVFVKLNRRRNQYSNYESIGKQKY